MSMDFCALARRFEAMDRGAKAELRRCAGLDDVSLVPVFYRLFPGRTDIRHQRVAFFLPWVRHAEGGKALGESLMQADISEMRMFQVLRSNSPNDLLQLRRLVQQAEPAADWNKLGSMLFYWGKDNKRRIIEDYFMARK